jgi:hypothetical protein
MPVALSAIKNELLPGLFDVRGQYDQIPKQWDKIFKVRSSEMTVETSSQMRFLALPQFKTEGGATAFDNNAGQRFTWNFIHNEIGLGYAITRKAVDDNLYKSNFKPTNLGLQRSFAQFKETICANVLNNAQTYDNTLGGDGVALCSTLHPYDGGTWANTFSTQLDLNESSLLQVQTTIPQTYVDEAGLRMLAQARRLVVPQALQPVAIRLTETALRPGTANNDVNAILSTAGGLPEGYIVMNYLTSNFAWFVTTNIDGLILMQRKPFEMDMQVDFITDNLLVKGYERYSANYNDPRCIWGNFPTS